MVLGPRRTPPPAPIEMDVVMGTVEDGSWSPPTEVTTHTFCHDPYAACVLPPPSPVMVAPPLLALLTVRFKRSTRQLVGSQHTIVGSYVIVEGDRGRDFGVVESVSGSCVGPTSSSHRSIIAYATEEEVVRHEGLRAFEEECTQMVQRRVAECHMTKTMAVQCVEYQFDMTKVTVFFKSLKQAVDFRHLQRVLFRDFRCRVWLQNV